MKQLKKIFAFALLFFPFLAQGASLAESLGLPAFGSRLNLPKDSSPGRIIAGIINVLLGFLGVLFTILIIYGGFKWMLSQGNSQQVDEAKKVIKNAAIGLIIVLVSYSISRTILQLIYQSSIDGYSQDFIGPPAL
ncbi:MAG: pilin [Patescibacteria group bacterium]|nr:pilin [Patescibacteria group bacterium]